jgi:hypothetical protein
MVFPRFCAVIVFHQVQARIGHVVGPVQVGGLEVPGEQGVFANRLFGELRVDARWTENPAAPTCAT